MTRTTPLQERPETRRARSRERAAGLPRAASMPRVAAILGVAATSFASHALAASAAPAPVPPVAASAGHGTLPAPAPSSAPADAVAWHAADAFALLPNRAPANLPTLAEIPSFARAFPAVLAHALGRSRAGKDFLAAHPKLADEETLNVYADACILRASDWKLVALRFEPDASLSWGDAPFLDARAARDPRASHGAVPVVRYTFQPFCIAASARAKDAALHFVAPAGLPPRDASALVSLHAAAREAVGRSDFRAREGHYLDFVRGPAMRSARGTLIAHMARWKAARGASPRFIDGLEAHFASVGSMRGAPLEESNGVRPTPLTHPALDALSARHWSADARASSLLREAFAFARDSGGALLGVRAMTTGFGGMRWFFSHLEADASGALRPGDVRAYATREGAPAIMLDQGAYDFDVPSVEAASPRRGAIDENNPLDDVQASAAVAWRAWRKETRIADPALSHASTQTCYSCHAAQERATMALRVARGEGPREFGYFFRQLGYVEGLPWISRRFVAEARRTAARLTLGDPR